MDLQPYVEAVRHELTLAARGGGEDAEALAERLTAPLESVIRLVMLEALAVGAEEITRELAPTSVEVRLRGRNPGFVVTAPIDQPDADAGRLPTDDDGGTWRVTLRLPENLRTKVEAAARYEGISINAWLVRAAAARVEPTAFRADTRRVTGWVR